jgi:hypothetical protein
MEQDGELPDQLRVMAECPSWFAWLDLAGWHARHRDEPKGTPPRVSATSPDGLIAAIRTAEKQPSLPQRVPAPPHARHVLYMEPADRETLVRVKAALHRL